MTTIFSFQLRIYLFPCLMHLNGYIHRKVPSFPFLRVLSKVIATNAILFVISMSFYRFLLQSAVDTNRKTVYI